MSQSPLTAEHMDRFITSDDIAKIASWGFDHVRLPVDYPLIESDEHPFEYIESGLNYLDQAIEWSIDRGLGVVLDLHKAPGYSFGSPHKNRLFTDDTLRKRFIDIWRMLTLRYKDIRDEIYFELLNEMVAQDPQDWNDLAEQTIAAIRGLDDSRVIVVGSNMYGSPSTFPDLRVFDDDNIVYTFHHYHPMLVTHQYAHWLPFLRTLNAPVQYPGVVRNLGELLQSSGQDSSHNQSDEDFSPADEEFQNALARLEGRLIDKSELREYIEPALRFRDLHGKQLYCGEFGVIDLAPRECRRNWIRDMVEILDNEGIAYALWNYKEMDFGLVDGEGSVVDQPVLEAVAGGSIM